MTRPISFAAVCLLIATLTLGAIAAGRACDVADERVCAGGSHE